MAIRFLLNSFKMNIQELNGIYTIVLPKPNEGFIQKYYKILDYGWYELDKLTIEATELIDNSTLPNSVDEISKIGIDSSATEWAEEIYFKLLSGKKCIYDDEYWQIVKRLPDFYAAEGSKQKLRDYLIDINLTTFLEFMKGMPVYRISIPNSAIPNYNLKGKGYHAENNTDWINFNYTLLQKCANSLSEESKSLLNKKYIKPIDGIILAAELKNDVEKLKVKQNGNEPNGHLIIKYDIDNRNYLYEGFQIHVLEDFINWIDFWTSKGFPIGLNTLFLIDS